MLESGSDTATRIGDHPVDNPRKEILPDVLALKSSI